MNKSLLALKKLIDHKKLKAEADMKTDKGKYRYWQQSIKKTEKELLAEWREKYRPFTPEPNLTPLSEGAFMWLHYYLMDRTFIKNAHNELPLFIEWELLQYRAMENIRGYRIIAEEEREEEKTLQIKSYWSNKEFTKLLERDMNANGIRVYVEERLLYWQHILFHSLQCPEGVESGLLDTIIYREPEVKKW